MTRLLIALGMVMALEAIAAAQAPASEISITTFNPEDAVAPASTVEGPGVKVGEGTILRPVVGMETGLVSNVFYQDNNPTAAGLLRLLAQIGTSSLSKERLAGTETDGAEENQGSFQYRADARLSYDLMLSNNDTVTKTGGLGAGATFKGMVNPQQRFSFGFDENYTRLIRAANFETDANTNRDINNLRLTLLYHPSGRSLSGALYYSNMIDIFESSSQTFANRWENRAGLHFAWRWLPQTQLYADVSGAIVTGLGTNAGAPAKVTSFPLRAEVGLATLLSISTTLNVHAGYENGFYQSGPSFSTPIVGVALGYRYSPLGRIALTYDLEFQDSVNANFYRDHVLRAWLQQIVAPFVFMVQPELHFREYQGITVVNGPLTRDDTIFSVIAGMHYNLKNSLAVTLDYRFTDVSTNYQYMGAGMLINPGYARHEALLGVRWAL